MLCLRGATNETFYIFDKESGAYIGSVTPAYKKSLNNAVKMGFNFPEEFAIIRKHNLNEEQRVPDVRKKAKQLAATAMRMMTDCT